MGGDRLEYLLRGTELYSVHIVYIAYKSRDTV